MKRGILLLGILGTWGALFVGQAAAATPIYTCGTVITAPGDYYLANDISNCYPSSGPAAAITIQADDVTLNLNGRTISGKGAFYGFGVFIYGASNVTVKYGTIKNFAQGILILSDTNVDPVRHPDNIRIYHNTVENNGRGIFGNRVGTVTDLVIENKWFIGNTQGAVVLYNVTVGEIFKNRFCENGKYGVSLSNSSCIDIAENSFTGNVNGIVFYTANYIRVLKNAFCYNYNGILIYAGKWNTISQNNFIENDNLHATDADKNTWKGNYWSGHNCRTPFVVNSATGAKDPYPLCTPTCYAPPCDCCIDPCCVDP